MKPLDRGRKASLGGALPSGTGRVTATVPYFQNFPGTLAHAVEMTDARDGFLRTQDPVMFIGSPPCALRATTAVERFNAHGYRVARTPYRRRPYWWDLYGYMRPLNSPRPAPLL